MTFAVRPRFGVEIECLQAGFEADAFVAAMNDAGLTCEQERYNHHTRAHWKLTTDSSCGWELVSPPLHWEDRHALREVLRLMRENGATVDWRCGLHVHHEWPWQHELGHSERYQRQAQVVALYEQCEPLLRVLMPDSRFWKTGDQEYDDNTGDYVWARRYCKWNSGMVDGGDKYLAVNTQPVESGRDTIEFRQHQGTLNARKTIGWLELTRQIVFAASLTEDQIKAPSRVEMVFATITPGSWKYFNDRATEHHTTMTDLITTITTDRRVADPAT